MSEKLGFAELCPNAKGQGLELLGGSMQAVLSMLLQNTGGVLVRQLFGLMDPGETLSENGARTGGQCLLGA